MENTLEQLLIEGAKKNMGAFRVGNFIVSPMYWAEDDNENIKYDIWSMKEEFEIVLNELEQHNKNTPFFLEELYE